MRGLSAVVRAPSNIALIKYMGKSDAQANLPENSSLSMTLDALSTWAQVERVAGDGAAVMASGIPRGAPPSARMPDLSASGRAKVLKHVERVRAAMPGVLARHGLAHASGAFDLSLRTANTFPEASGIASSASAFAAITLGTALACSAAAAAFGRAYDSAGGVALRRELARLSRQGSGSSCRSFEGPFVLWEGEDAVLAEARAPELAHFVVLISSEAKSVSSSEAHARVKTSPLWQGRKERVERRLEQLRSALAQGDLSLIARLAWSESWEMHSLFHTSAEPFSYWKPGSIDALHWLGPQVAAAGSGTPPIVTMDAGPNVHVIVPLSDAEGWRARLRKRFGADAVLEDRPGLGASIVSAEEGA